MKAIRFVFSNYPIRYSLITAILALGWFYLFAYGADTIGWWWISFVVLALVTYFAGAWAVNAEKISHR